MKRKILTCLLLPYCLLVSAQEINQEIKTENHRPFLVGQITTEGLSSKSYKDWYSSNYDQYEIASEQVNLFKNELSKHKILVFMGTWCGDSKREVPRFIKILEAAEFPMEHLKIVAVDRRKERYKKSPNGEEWGLSIKRVPTFIFLKNGKETNRIIERPITTLEDDIKAIVTGAAYTPNYPSSLHFD